MKNSLLQNHDAVSPVLGAILILAIGITILTNMQLNFIPVWNAEEELSHFKEMQDDFKEFKSSIGSSIQSGTALSAPLSMGFRYSPKMFVYNPRESAYASLVIENDTWVEIRYNELSQEGVMDDNTSIKNISTSTITYTLQGAQKFNSLIYEHGLIRRSGSDYTSSSQTLVANGTIYALGIKPLGVEVNTGVEKRTANIYPTSQQKNSVIGENVWLILHTRPEYVNWWNQHIGDEVRETGGDVVTDPNNINGLVIARINRTVIRMGEAYISTAPKKAPSHAPPYRLVKVTPEDINLPAVGTTSLAVEVQDYYNNPVPNVRVNFSADTSRGPSNACTTGKCLLQDWAVSGADGRASIMLKTDRAGMYYINASIPAYDATYNATFIYPASSQAGYISLESDELNPDGYLISATLTNGTGEPEPFKDISYEASDGNLVPQTGKTNATGSNSTLLDTSGAAGVEVTNIRISGVTNNSATITWDTVERIKVTATRQPGGYIFSSIDVPTKVNSTGCVRYGKSPQNYPDVICASSELYSHSFTLNLNASTIYYFKVNSTRLSSGVNVTSTEYMFVTEPNADSVPPGNATGLAAESTGSLYINWRWTDPADADFDHVNVYIDGTPEGTVGKGVQYFNATYLMPNSTHTIAIETVDASGNVNTYQQTNTNTTTSLYTYLTNFINTTGTIISFDSAKSGSDGGASALFDEASVGGASERNNFTNVTGNTATSGSISNWANMQIGGAFANFTEGGSGDTPGGRINVTANAIGASDTTGDTLAALQLNDTAGASPGAVSTVDGWYTAIKNRVMYVDGFDTSGISGTITSATLRVQYSVQAGGYSGTNNVTWGREGAALNATDIRPVNGQVDVIRSYDLFAQGMDTAAELSTLNIEFTNNDGGGSQSVSFDYIWIDVTYSGLPGAYSMSITTYTDPVPADTDYYLELRYRIDSNETGYDVYIFNGTDWNNRGSLTSNAWAPFNITLSSQEYNSGNVSIRYFDQNPSGTSRGNLSIDYQRVHGYTPGIDGGSRLDVTTNTTDIPEANNREFQLKYNVSGDSFTLWLWNSTSLDWNNKTVLNGTGGPYYNVTLLADELVPYETITGSAYPMNKYYVLARYQDQNPAATGRLYIDYQRVHSS